MKIVDLIEQGNIMNAAIIDPVPAWVRIKTTIQSRNPRALFLSGFDEALVGSVSREIGGPVVAQYSGKECARILAQQGENYNIAAGSIEQRLRTWSGEQTPVVVEDEWD